MSDEIKLPVSGLHLLDTAESQAPTLNLSGLRDSVPGNDEVDCSGDSSEGDINDEGGQLTSSSVHLPIAPTGAVRSSTRPDMVYWHASYPNQVWQVLLTSSVGAANKAGQPATNKIDDVMLVQTLLNAVPAIQGGPSKKLYVDGLAYQQTQEAIGKFQRHTFGWSDSRVDKDGQTFKSLLDASMKQNRSMPSGIRHLTSPSNATLGALNTFRYWPQTLPTFDLKSEWTVQTSETYAGGIGVVQAGGGQIHVKRDTEARVYKLTYAGVGIGLSPIPVSFAFSSPSFPNTPDNRIYRGPSAPAKGKWNTNDFLGPCLIYDAGISAGPGAGVALIVFGGDLVTAKLKTFWDPTGMATTVYVFSKIKGVAAVAGVTMSIPGASVGCLQATITSVS